MCVCVRAGASEIELGKCFKYILIKRKFKVFARSRLLNGILSLKFHSQFNSFVYSLLKNTQTHNVVMIELNLCRMFEKIDIHKW